MANRTVSFVYMNGLQGGISQDTVPLLIDKHCADLKWVYNLNVMEEEDSIEVVNFFEKVT